MIGHSEKIILAAALTAGLLPACSPADKSADCGGVLTADGACAGIPAAACDGDCTAGCARVRDVDGPGDLSAALSAALSGDCLYLHQGAYGAIDLPSGVSVIGDSPTATSVSSLTLAQGDGAAVRSLQVGVGGVQILGATHVTLDTMIVSGSEHDGVHVGAGSSVIIVRSRIEGSGEYGVFVETMADVTLDHTLVSGAQRSGVWAEGACNGCVCAGPPRLTMVDSVLYQNRVTGLSLVGARATLSRTDIVETKVGDLFFNSQYGGGLAASCGSDVQAKRFRVLGSKAWGALLDGSTAALGGDADGETVEMSGNERGVWIQNVSCGDAVCVSLHQASVADNKAVGVGVAGGSQGIIICKSAVTGTSEVVEPVYQDGDIGGNQKVGDGLHWLDGSQVLIDGLTMSGNQRQSILIDGPVASGSSIGVLTQSGGDEATGVLQQDFTTGMQPDHGNTVVVNTATHRVFGILQPEQKP
ncbi:MAG: right-handed parallel beta-helix repeat-containing protein [Minicystis sp.]